MAAILSPGRWVKIDWNILNTDPAISVLCDIEKAPLVIFQMAY